MTRGTRQGTPVRAARAGDTHSCGPAVSANAWFLCFDDYVLSHPCRTCGAQPWADCTAPRKTRQTRRRATSPATPARRSDFQHAARQDAGSAHYSRDVGRAPWLEDRVSGTCYSTIRRPDPKDVMHFNQLASDAHELAQALIDGQSPDAYAVIFGGNYCEPAEMARLLHATAQVLELAT